MSNAHITRVSEQIVVRTPLDVVASLRAYAAQRGFSMSQAALALWRAALAADCPPPSPPDPARLTHRTCP